VLVSSEEAKPALQQHTGPCSDCPWRRDSLHGWLGGLTSQQWVRAAHGDEVIDCHVHTGAQCAGAAIYRANVAKLPRDAANLRLPADREAVFASPDQFKEHHEEVGILSDDLKALAASAPVCPPGTRVRWNGVKAQVVDPADKKILRSMWSSKALMEEHRLVVADNGQLVWARVTELTEEEVV
jgi:hypothetical protein